MQRRAHGPAQAAADGVARSDDGSEIAAAGTRSRLIAEGSASARRPAPLLDAFAWSFSSARHPSQNGPVRGDGRDGAAHDAMDGLAPHHVGFESYPWTARGPARKKANVEPPAHDASVH
jgi:hypothetical protein